MKTDYTCSNCKRKLTAIKSVDFGDIEIGIGDILICCHCATINEITPLDTKIFTDFDRVSPEEAADIKFALRCIQAKHQQS